MSAIFPNWFGYVSTTLEHKSILLLLAILSNVSVFIFCFLILLFFNILSFFKFTAIEDNCEVGCGATIDRGYKAGFGYRENGGNGLTEYSGGGGAGARGGDGPSLGGNGGGGGGSGYSNGEITLLTSTTLSSGTRVGGNDDTAFIVIESTDEASDNEPVFPAASSI